MSLGLVSLVPGSIFIWTPSPFCRQSLAIGIKITKYFDVCYDNRKLQTGDSLTMMTNKVGPKATHGKHSLQTY